MTKRTGSGQQELFGQPDGAEDARIVQTKRSMLWAAYADALGSISELVDRRGLRSRIGTESVKGLVPWKRRVGGRKGVSVLLPAGCWSDDTQLRMAVSRSINRHGFDVETFARIELPIWPSYALGGGRASKAAAKNLAHSKTLWYANTFRGWCEAGGNGGAMRIQPHVWSSKDLRSDFLLDVIADTICTHGHPRAIVGACFHASTLAHCMRKGVAPTREECHTIASELADALSLIEGHSNLGSTWIGLWERETGQPFSNAWCTTVKELHQTIDTAMAAFGHIRDVRNAYLCLSERLGLESPHQRGSGILTSVAATVLATTMQHAHEAVLVAANALGTDTDTIATMAGALLGACVDTPIPPDDPLDSGYLLDEATRLASISRGNVVNSHRYPDILTWIAPQAQADALVFSGTQLAVEGLGSVMESKAAVTWTDRRDFGWQWVRTDFGQTLLIKRRPDPRSMKPGNAPEGALHPASPLDPGANESGKPPTQSDGPLPDRTLSAKGPRDIIRRQTRLQVWELISRHRIRRTIPEAFEAQGFTAGTRNRFEDRWQGVFNAYDNNIDWTDPDQVSKALRVFETMVSRVVEIDLHPLRQSLKADGYLMDDTGLIRALDTQPLTGPTHAQIRDPHDLEEYIGRLLAACDTTPPLAITCGKALITSTAEYVLEELGETYSDKADLSDLADLAQRALGIHLDAVPQNRIGSQTILRALSSLFDLAIGVAHLPTQPLPKYNLQPRHARLVVEGAQTYCHFLLETLRERRGEGM